MEEKEGWKPFPTFHPSNLPILQRILRESKRTFLFGKAVEHFYLLSYFHSLIFYEKYISYYPFNVTCL